jgi:hypothetical protein
MTVVPSCIVRRPKRSDEKLTVPCKHLSSARERVMNESAMAIHARPTVPAPRQLKL